MQGGVKRDIIVRLLILGVLRLSNVDHNHLILLGQASQAILKLANGIFHNIVSVFVCLVVFVLF